MANTIVSIGYEKRTPEELILALQAANVKKLVDVRELPLSRRKGFSKSLLSSALESSGIAYVHLRVAGNPFRKEAANLAECLKKYRKHLQENPDVLNAVENEMLDGPVAMLCVEHEHICCHRSVLIDEMQKSGRKLRLVRA